MLSDHYNEKVTVTRLSTTAGAKKAYTNHIVDLPCKIMPLDDKITQDIADAFGKDYLLLCDVADINEGDHIMRGTDEYRIVGIKKFDSFLSRPGHYEIAIRAFKS